MSSLGTVGKLTAATVGGAVGFALLGTGGGIAAALGTLYLVRDKAISRRQEDPFRVHRKVEAANRARQEQIRRNCAMATIIRNSGR